MQIIINSTDTIEALIVARNTINDLLARREPPKPALIEKQAPAPTQPEGVTATGVSKPAPAPAPEKKAKPKVVKAISADEVRAVMVAKSAEGKKREVVDVLGGMGFTKLSEVPPELLVDLKAKVEAL